MPFRRASVPLPDNVVRLRPLRGMSGGTNDSVLDRVREDADSRTMRMDRHAHIRPITIFGVATALTFFSAFQAFYFVSTFTEKPAPFPLLFVLNLGYWYSWACVAPAIIWLSRRFPLDKQNWHFSLPVHVVGVFVATTLHIAMAVSSRMAINWAIGDYSWAMGDAPGSWRLEAQRMFFLNFDWEMMTYWAIVGLSHALDYHREAQARALSAAQLETRLVEAQLQTLQRQLHPHFLFNTLNTISALMHRDVDAADAMIARLSDLLRISLRSVGVQEVPLKDELDFLRSTSRSSRRASGTVSPWCSTSQPDTLDALVPNLILQPLVENAIKHGIGPRPAPGTIDDPGAAARASGWSSRSATTASAWRPAGAPTSTGRRPVEHARAARASLRRAPALRVPAAPRAAGCTVRRLRSRSASSAPRTVVEAACTWRASREQDPNAGRGRRAAGARARRGAARRRSRTSRSSASAPTAQQAVSAHPAAAARTSCSSTCRCRPATASASSSTSAPTACRWSSSSPRTTSTRCAPSRCTRSTTC